MPRRPQSDFHELEAALGYTFVDPDLLKLALTHRSLAYEARGGDEEKNPPGTDNEQLEFLGDAVLGLIVTELIFHSFPALDEGQLTRMRAALVSRKRMGEAGKALDLGRYLFTGASAGDSGVRERPTVLANAAEAVLAAMYLDAVRSGAPSELTALRTLIRRLILEPELPALEAAVAEGAHGALRDNKTVLQERVQATPNARLRYIDTDQQGPPHDRHFFVEVRLERVGQDTITLAAGSGRSKREAQQDAAGHALAAWSALVPPETPA